MVVNFFKRDNDRRSKILILGDTQAGKTSLRHRYIKKYFRDTEPLTIGLEFSSTVIPINGFNLKIDIYDVAGQEKFEIRKKILQNIQGAMIVFDLTRYETFFSLRKWVDTVQKHNPRSRLPVVIVGNKLDLKRQRAISKEEAEEFVKSLKFDRTISFQYIDYIETSAKTGENTDFAFETLARNIVKCFY